MQPDVFVEETVRAKQKGSASEYQSEGTAGRRREKSNKTAAQAVKNLLQNCRDAAHWEYNGSRQMNLAFGDMTRKTSLNKCIMLFIKQQD